MNPIYDPVEGATVLHETKINSTQTRLIRKNGELIVQFWHPIPSLGLTVGCWEEDDTNPIAKNVFAEYYADIDK